MKRIRFRHIALPLLALVLMLVPGGAYATTVIDFSVDDLVQFSNAAVRARVVGVQQLDDEHTRYVIEVNDVLFGPVAETQLDLDLLRTIEGMPQLGTGDEIVVFINLDNRIEKIIGLKWGTYRIKSEELLDHDGMPLELRSESRSGSERQFLRPRRAESPTLKYSTLKAEIGEIHNRLSKSTNGSTPAGPVRLDRR